MTGPLMIGLDTAPTQTIATAISAELLRQPAISDTSLDWRWADALEDWRSAAAQGRPAEHIVVALLDELESPTPLAELDPQAWVRRCEIGLARWVAALGVAQRRCGDGGRIIAIVDRVAPLDCSGRSAETAISDAVEALIRSLARSEGPRGVRVNLLTTPARLTSLPVIDPQPPLATFPGSIGDEVIATCRMLLSEDATALTGAVLHIDSGRSWR
jgi:NAD(P)-dependent dehydrogenase (short-subunit alcohol dehydrogenase family)